jgi:hypothetical protein
MSLRLDLGEGATDARDDHALDLDSVVQHDEVSR